MRLIYFALFLLWVSGFFLESNPNTTLAFLPLILGLGSSVVGGILGNAAMGSAEDRARALQEKSVQEWMKINIPDPEQQKLFMQRFAESGEIEPEYQQAIAQADTEMSKVQVDPKLRSARMRALSQLEDFGTGEANVLDNAATQKAISDAGVASRGRQEAIFSDLSRRGQLGGGQEIAARMSQAQSDADRLNNQMMGLETDRRKRAYDAVMGAGDLAGKMEAQDWDQKSDVAKARDVINAFNTTNARDVMRANTEAKNKAKQLNWERGNEVSDLNTRLSNDEQRYNKELLQKKFENESAKATGLSGQYGKQADNELKAGQNAANMWTGMGNAGLKIAGAVDKKIKDDDWSW